MCARSSTAPGEFDPRSVSCVGIIAAMHKRRIAAAVDEVVEWLKKRDIRALLRKDQAEALSRHELGVDVDELAGSADLLLSMGGDGTLLATARLAAPLGKPVLGVNLGGFGFLASVPSGAEMLNRLAEVMQSPLEVRQRMMLQAKVRRREEEVGSFTALNDVVVGKGAFSRLFRMRTSISGVPISHFPADGMIVATATGSTGYSLSAGGPVVDPDVRVIMLTPICAHALSARTLVVPADRVIEMSLPDLRGEEVNLTADGQEGFTLRAGDRVEVREAPFSARLLAPKDSGFYTRLRSKLGWGSHRS
jgi:NAD+ kinase